jgi:CBS-domain-containing membrane protein
MTSPVFAVTPDTDLEECIHQMEEHQVRRMPVKDDNGCCCGMVAQADIARCAPEQEAGELVREISQPESMMQSAMIH